MNQSECRKEGIATNKKDSRNTKSLSRFSQLHSIQKSFAALSGLSKNKKDAYAKNHPKTLKSRIHSLQNWKGWKLIEILAWIGCVIGLWEIYLKNKREHRMWMPFGYGWSRVTSGSMEPNVMTGDVVVIHRQPDYQTGDVVIYRRAKDNELIIHRIVKKKGESFVAKGDANHFEDAPINKDQICGKMIAKTGPNNKIIKFLGSDQGFLMLLGLLLAAMIPFEELKSQTKER